MAKKSSRILSAVVICSALLAVIAAMHDPGSVLVTASAQDAKTFDEKIASLAQVDQQGSLETVRINEVELTSKLQQSLDENPSADAHVAMTRISVHLRGDGFVGTCMLNVHGINLVLTVAGTLTVLDGGLQIQTTSAKLGSLPIPAPAFQHIVAKKLDSPETREHLRLPDFIKNVSIVNGELLLEPRQEIAR